MSVRPVSLGVGGQRMGPGWVTCGRTGSQLPGSPPCPSRPHPWGPGSLLPTDLGCTGGLERGLGPLPSTGSGTLETALAQATHLDVRNDASGTVKSTQFLARTPRPARVFVSNMYQVMEVATHPAWASAC